MTSNKRNQVRIQSIAKRICVQNLSVVQFTVLGSQEDKTWRNLAGLAWPANLGAFTESFHLLSRSGSRLKRSMHRARCDSIDSDAFRSEIFGQSTREGD